jgi:hypothetical protein
LDEDARTVSGVHLGTSRATVIHVAKRAETMPDDLVAALTLHVDNEIDAASVVLESGVVETLCAGEPRWASWIHTSSCVAWIGRSTSTRRNLRDDTLTMGTTLAPERKGDRTRQKANTISPDGREPSGSRTRS